MQELLLELYKQTSTQSTMTWMTWIMLIYGILHVGLYISEHKFDEKNWKYVVKMLSPLIITLVFSSYSTFDNYQSIAKVKEPNVENYEMKRDGNTIHFISKNKNLESADLNIVSENDTNFYLKYDNKIIEVKKDELKFTN